MKVLWYQKISYDELLVLAGEKFQHLQLYPLRGPFLMTVVLMPLIVKNLLQLSTTTIISALIVIVGLVLTFYDAMLFLKDQFQRQCSESLKCVVLDDVLRNIFDPQIGIIAIVLSMVVGNASMYSLNLTEEEKVRLVQSCLLTRKEDTREILLAPGGIRLLFPESIQQWLLPESSTKEIGDGIFTMENEKLSQEDLSDVVSQQDSSSTQSTEEEMHSVEDLEPTTLRAAMKNLAETASRDFLSIDPSSFEKIPTNPLTVMASIFKDKFIDTLKHSVAPIAFTMVPTAAALLLLLRAKKSRNTQVTVLSLAAGASFLNCCSPQLVKRVLRATHLLDLCRTKRLQTAVAFFVFCYFSKKQTRR
mmetsp:Transcript_2277/g.3449  ORF Transcript_2277/g.3449 Transcript_2277/m.3449 type:complete len:361 (+) Transcript_2277:112-1194(+)